MLSLSLLYPVIYILAALSIVGVLLMNCLKGNRVQAQPNRQTSPSEINEMQPILPGQTLAQQSGQPILPVNYQTAYDLGNLLPDNIESIDSEEQQQHRRRPAKIPRRKSGSRDQAPNYFTEIERRKSRFRNYGGQSRENRMPLDAAYQYPPQQHRIKPPTRPRNRPPPAQQSSVEDGGYAYYYDLIKKTNFIKSISQYNVVKKPSTQTKQPKATFKQESEPASAESTVEQNV